MIISGQWGCWTRRASPAASQRTSPRASAPPACTTLFFADQAATAPPASHRTEIPRS